MELEIKILSKEIQQLLYDNGKTVGTAESCTGGRIAEAIIATPGASNYFQGGVIAYSNNAKINLLHVERELIEQHTAVSEEVAKAMVSGACDALQCDYALASTGVGGPEGGTPESPVGTIWLAYGSKNDVHTFKCTGDLGRDLNLSKATSQILKLFLEYLKSSL